MRKRFIPLLILTVVVVLASAPTAMADHCRKCKQNPPRCQIAPFLGWPFCDDTGASCVVSGAVCEGKHPFVDPEEPFAFEYIVASVERVDQPQPAPSETRVASIEEPGVVNR